MKEDFLATNIDTTVSPRDDFFAYANGAWLERNPIPPDQGRWGISLSEDIYARLRRLSEAVAATPAPRGTVEQLIGDFWFTGMDSITINRQGLAPLLPELDRIARTHSIKDVIDVVTILQRRNFLFGDNYLGWIGRRVLFDGRVEQDERNTSRRIYSLTQGGISLGPLAYAATDPQRVKIRDSFRRYLFQTFLRLHHDSARAKTSADAVFAVEAQLATAFSQGAEYHMIGRTELSRLAPTIDWHRYFRQLGVTRIDSVNMRRPRFYQALDSLLRVVPLASWQDYLRFCLVRSHAPFLDDATFGEFFAWVTPGTGAPQSRARWQRVVWQERHWLGQPLARLFVKEYFAPDVKARHYAVAESIRQAFQDRIVQLDWMSDSTKQHALLKLARLRITIGSSERWTDVSTMPLRRDSYARNMIRSAEWFHDWEVQRLNTPVDRTEADLHDVSIGSDGWYDVQNNAVLLDFPIGAAGWGDEQLDDAFLYGATILGHEISHAFDSDGRYYDADGNKVDWWTAKDSTAFEGRAQVLVDQYNAIMPIDGLHMDGRRSLPENMADLVGLRVTLDAFKRTEQYRRNEKIAGFTPLQRFFLAFAYKSMGHERPEYLAATVRGPYAPYRERVNGPLVHIPEFYDAFGVKPGDRMYRSEDARARIW